MQPPGGKRSYESLVVDLLTPLQAGDLLTDVNPGSVVRTLVEAFARQLAEVHAQLALIYEMGYIDTATGESLEYLVALLDQKRVDGLQVIGEAVFQRDTRVAGRVVIPAGTGLTIQSKDKARQFSYRTAQEAELQAGQSAVTVPIIADAGPGVDPRNLVLTEDDLGDVSQLSSLAGIGAVAVTRPTALRGYRESDEDLRRRVKGLIAGAGGGTQKALEQAILATGKARSVLFRDAGTAGGADLQPGELDVVVDAALTVPQDYEAIRDAVNQKKGPGILVRLRPVRERRISLRLIIRLAETSLSAAKRQALRRGIEDTVKRSVEVLPVGQKLLWNPLQAKVLTIAGVLDVADGTTATVDGVAIPILSPGSPTPREIPPTLDALERLTLPAKGAAVTVIFDGESVVNVQVVGSLTTEQAAVLDGPTRTNMVRRVEELLLAKNGAGGERTLSFGDVIDTLLTGQAGTGLSRNSFAVHISDVERGGETELTAESIEPYHLGPDDVLYPDPAGPVWGDES